MGVPGGSDLTGTKSSALGGVVLLHIVERFGRFPHRNAALGRSSTAAEKAYLKAGGFAG